MKRARRGLLVAAVALAAAFLLASWRAQVAAEPHPYVARLPAGPLVLAHQGGAGLWPSNTMVAFEGAAALGADVLEVDVHRTADGRLVVRHDATLDRTTDGAGPVAARSLDEVAALDAGFWWTAAGTHGPAADGEAASAGEAGRFPYRGAGATVPTLRAVFDAFPRVPVNVELKPEDPEVARDLCAAVREAGREDTVMVASFHGAALRAFRRACPEVATSASPGEVRTFVLLSRARLAGPYRPPFDALQVPEVRGGIRVVTTSLLRAAHAKGVPVQVWTVNDRAAMERLLELGVDGLITDRPDRALAALGRAADGAELPPFARP